jgi:hypothetical protein
MKYGSREEGIKLNFESNSPKCIASRVTTSAKDSGPAELPYVITKTSLVAVSLS